MALKRMDNVGIVVDDLAATIDFFRALGLELEGRTTIEGEWAGRVTGLGDQLVEIANDAHAGRSRAPRALPLSDAACCCGSPERPGERSGLPARHVAVDDIDDTLERLHKRGAQLVGEVVQYKDAYRLCYIRGPEASNRTRPRTQLTSPAVQ